MKYCCPQCEREDEVIGDSSPRCLVCKTALIKATDGYKGLWMSPKIVIERMITINKKHGFHAAANDRRFKQEREAWTSAIWALGRTETTGRDYWVEIETVEQTPDTKVHYLDQSADHNKIMT
jgi:hypothetical protein